MADVFQDTTITLQHSNGTIVQQHLPAQLDTVNIPFTMEVGGMIPTDQYDLYSIGWTSPIPERSDYLVDEQTGNMYSVFGNVAIYADHLEVRVTRYSGVRP